MGLYVSKLINSTSHDFSQEEFPVELKPSPTHTQKVFFREVLIAIHLRVVISWFGRFGVIHIVELFCFSFMLSPSALCTPALVPAFTLVTSCTLWQQHNHKGVQVLSRTMTSPWPARGPVCSHLCTFQMLQVCEMRATVDTWNARVVFLSSKKRQILGAGALTRLIQFLVHGSIAIVPCFKVLLFTVAVTQGKPWFQNAKWIISHVLYSWSLSCAWLQLEWGRLLLMLVWDTDPLWSSKGKLRICHVATTFHFVFADGHWLQASEAMETDQKEMRDILETGLRTILFQAWIWEHALFWKGEHTV